MSVLEVHGLWDYPTSRTPSPTTSRSPSPARHPSFALGSPLQLRTGVNMGLEGTQVFEMLRGIAVDFELQETEGDETEGEQEQGDGQGCVLDQPRHHMATRPLAPLQIDFDLSPCSEADAKEGYSDTLQSPSPPLSPTPSSTRLDLGAAPPSVLLIPRGAPRHARARRRSAPASAHLAPASSFDWRSEGDTLEHRSRSLPPRNRRRMWAHTDMSSSSSVSLSLSSMSLFDTSSITSMGRWGGSSEMKSLTRLGEVGCPVPDECAFSVPRHHTRPRAHPSKDIPEDDASTYDQHSPPSPGPPFSASSFLLSFPDPPRQRPHQQGREHHQGRPLADQPSAQRSSAGAQGGRVGQSGTIAQPSQLKSDLTPAQNDFSPTLPAVHILDPKSSTGRDSGQIPIVPEQGLYCPPSPTLPPSLHTPHCLQASPILTTPHDRAAPGIRPRSPALRAKSPPLPPASGASARFEAHPSADRDSFEASPVAAPVSPSSRETHEAEKGPASREVGDSMSFGTRPEQGGNWYDQDIIDPHPPGSRLDRPSHLHPFHHKPSPSVPSSTRTASTLSNHVDSSTTAPTLISHNTSKRRYSKVTAFSSSSSSSVYSSDSSSLGNNGSGPHWQGVERPDISTVHEEEGSLEVDLREGHGTAGGRDDRGRDSKDPARPTDLSSHFPHSATYPTLRSNSSLDRLIPLSASYPTLHSQNSSTTLVARFPHPPPPPAIRNRTERAGTISSTTSGRSTKSVHPFANVVVRPASPPPAGTPGQLQVPFTTASGLAASRSAPNLADALKMAAGTVAPAHQVTLLSTEVRPEETCPICVESLSSTYRLPGEKAHVVPDCGHELHRECFEAVYGAVPPEGSRKHVGVCGVCRQPIRITGDGERKGRGGNKLAMLTGQNATPPGPISSSAESVRSAPGRGSNSGPSDPTADDPIEPSPGLSALTSSRSLNADIQPKVVVPSISIRSEFVSISRGNRKGKQSMVAIVTIEVPSAGDRGRYPARNRPHEVARSFSGELSPPLPPSPSSAMSYSDIFAPNSARSAASLPSATSATPASFSHIIADLRNRVVDYKTSGLESLGALRLFDLLCVRKGSMIREFNVYLFQDAVICISEERKSSFRQIFSSGSSTRSHESSGTSGTGRGVLKLKGRIYMRHVRKVVDSSVQGELSLTILLEDEGMEPLILAFKDRSSHETWKSNFARLLEEMRAANTGHAAQSASKIAKLMGAGAPTPVHAHPRQPFSPTATVSSPATSASAYGSGPVDNSSLPSAASGPISSPSTPAHRELTAGDLAFLQPLAPIHTPLDLVIILSLPPPGSAAALPLKAKLIKQSIAFVLAALGPKDRVALVGCEMGTEGVVRKTPFLSTTRFESRNRLEWFVETLGAGKVVKDEFEVSVGREERRDVVTAVNVALDVVLQRKAKNPLTGMILISDTSDVIKRAQMDLVTARLDAANTPVHAIGYGKSHDPSPLWMICNHTHGSYTYVKEWYHLRDALAGVLGGLMSISTTNMKLHLTCQDNEFRMTKITGTANAILSQDGKDVDIEMKELRYGELREILVELDMEPGGAQRYSNSNEGSDESAPMATAGRGPRGSPSRSPGQGGAVGSVRKAPSSNFNVEQSIRGLGLETLSVGGSSANAAAAALYEDTLIDEVPVLEIDCSFNDPAAGRSVARLAHPVLLTMAIVPPSAAPAASSADPTVARRRMELLASDMITRALLLASRKKIPQAMNILIETKRIVETISAQMQAHLASVGGGEGRHGDPRSVLSAAPSKRELQVMLAMEAMAAVVGDVESVREGLEEHQEMFERDHRNYAAQQAVVLRTQKSWTARSAMERLYCTKEVLQVVQIGGEWSPRQ